MVFHRAGHGRRRFSRPDHDQAPSPYRLDRGQVRWQAQRGLGTGDGGIEHASQQRLHSVLIE
jgi:hypothetical protein